MREFLKSRGRWVRTGWLLPLVLLPLPNCTNDFEPFTSGGRTFDPGPQPSGAIMCDIPKPTTSHADNCAQPSDLQPGVAISRAYAAVALAQGEGKSIYTALDYSATALSACNGSPGKTVLQGPFPWGTTVCINCGTQIGGGKKYLDANAACVAKCIDMTSLDGGPQTFCQQNAHVSTNFDKNTCFNGACNNGAVNANFADPRVNQEPVIWAEQNGTSAGSSGNNITRTAGRSGNFDAGGYSKQSVTQGDGWVEFQVSDNTKAYVVGFSENAAAHETLEDIQFALGMNADGTLSVYQANGVPLPGSFGTYTAGERFRVRIVEKTDGSNTATLSATRLTGACTAGTICNETAIATLTGNPAYPFQVDVSLVDPGAILQNVTMVRIQ